MINKSDVKLKQVQRRQMGMIREWRMEGFGLLSLAKQSNTEIGMVPKNTLRD